ncbi:MAG: hypothetical protein FRX49_11539 [Trebouxia sp. A1-2]|nr:MAG: hypothetical protein FRX49_11539 [Trebouxia sp. A1-2]
MMVPDRDEEVAAWSDSVAGQVVLLQSSPDQHWGLRGSARTCSMLGMPSPITVSTYVPSVECHQMSAWILVNQTKHFTALALSVRVVGDRSISDADLFVDTVRAYLIPGSQQEMEDGRVLLPHKLLHKFLLLFFHQVLATLYETIKSGIDDLEGLSAPPLPGHYGPKKRNVPMSPSAGINPLPITKSKISDSSPLEYLWALVSSTCLANAGSEMTTKLLGPKQSRKTGPYARNSLYSGTKTGWPTISLMSPVASGMRTAASLRHCWPSLANHRETLRPAACKEVKPRLRQRDLPGPSGSLAKACLTGRKTFSLIHP